MKPALRNGAVAFGLIAAVGLTSAPPAEARSIERHGYFGGSWAPIGPSNNRYVRRHYRYGPGYYAYAPRYYAPDYYYGPGYYYGPRFGLGFSF
jgi:hypothetical protein